MESFKGGRAMASDAQKKARDRWNKANTVVIALRFNKEKDKDVLKRLDEKGKTAYIRGLIRKDIESEK